ncbi:PLDc N-terminal domain-containing protein [Pedobacter frigoris]|uniref:Cardiolipin synthase N-terminal domain-containing protein n=1 Tax=Pedobacter frigoris TaxID=2571272 RepID=A0A4U1CK21_9SPHI|nr:hypothetical protein FA047_06755 [Pedobacter frigoris]
MIYTILILFLLGYMIYGLVQVLKNKSLTLMSKVVWIFIVVFLPVLGTAGYLRTTFKERHGRW